MSKKSKDKTVDQAKPTPIIINSILLWKILKKEDVEKLDILIPFEVEKYMAELLNLNNYEIDLKEACFLDYFVTQYWWAAKQRKLNHELTSSFFSIVYELMDNLREKKCSLAFNMSALESILVEAIDAKVFTDDVLKEIITHLERTFFQNYKLYQFVLNEDQSEIVIPKEILVECPKPIGDNYPAPLDEAMPIKMYNKYVLKIDDEPKKAKSGTVQEEDEDNDLDLTQEVIDKIQEKFSGLSIDDARKIIVEITNELVTDLKTDMKNKIKDRESALLNELEKNQKNSTKKK